MILKLSIKIQGFTRHIIIEDSFYEEIEYMKEK
jgi:predicted DNA-binding ribbon-helix-helix protein